MREVSAFFDSEPKPQSPEGDRFEVLLTLVEAYEAKHVISFAPMLWPQYA
jgi:HTH-type transcriptional regulator/antitoxin HigA